MSFFSPELEALARTITPGLGSVRYHPVSASGSRGDDVLLAGESASSRAADVRRQRSPSGRNTVDCGLRGHSDAIVGRAA